MGRKRFGIFQACLALFVLAACSSPAERTLSLQAPQYATLPNGVMNTLTDSKQKHRHSRDIPCEHDSLH